MVHIFVVFLSKTCNSILIVRKMSDKPRLRDILQNVKVQHSSEDCHGCCCRWNSVPSKDMFTSYRLVPVNVTSFR